MSLKTALEWSDAEGMSDVSPPGNWSDAEGMSVVPPDGDVGGGDAVDPVSSDSIETMQL